MIKSLARGTWLSSEWRHRESCEPLDNGLEVLKKDVHDDSNSPCFQNWDYTDDAILQKENLVTLQYDIEGFTRL